MTNIPVNNFTLAGNQQLNIRLQDVLGAISADIAALPESPHILAVFLGGGYGRGEGGVFWSDGREPDLYNDLDFFVLNHSGADRELCDAIDGGLKKIGEKWSAFLKVDVDFSRCRPPESLRKVRSTLMFQELNAGHYLVFGDDSALFALGSVDFHQIPASEGIRLMLNRGAGLILAYEQLDGALGGDRQMIDFVTRNLWKAVLGCGDAALICQEQYCAGIEKRAVVLKQLSGLPSQLTDRYEKAIMFKKYPCLPEEKLLPDLLSSSAGLWLKTATMLAGGNGGIMKPEELRSRFLKNSRLSGGRTLKNQLLNLYSFRYGVRRISLGVHPRQFLFPDLYLVLFVKCACMEYSKVKHMKRVLSSWKSVWTRFN